MFQFGISNFFLWTAKLQMGFQINIDTKDNKNFKQNHPIYLLQTASGRKAKMVGVMW